MVNGFIQTHPVYGSPLLFVSIFLGMGSAKVRWSVFRTLGMIWFDVEVGKQQRLVARLVAATVGFDGDENCINLR